ncbi:hypothetical protein D9M70_458020 [compost metagenome]
MSLVGCSGIPSVPYVEPVAEEGTARLRVTTNSSVYGDQVVGACAPSIRHKMAEAGRFGEDGRPAINYPQYPLKPTGLGMRKSFESELVQYVGAVRMAEGLYTKVKTEYRVKADLPFQISTLGAAVGSYGSTYSACPEVAKVYKLMPGKDYQAIVGVGTLPDGNGNNGPLRCFFGVFELVPIPNSEFAMPKLLESTEPPATLCRTDR